MQTGSISHAMLRLVTAGLALATGAAGADWSREEHIAFGPAQALKQSQHYSQQIDARQVWQQARIEAARREGALTSHEFRILTRQQDDIAALKRRCLADGRLDAALDAAGRTLRTENYDQQARVYRDYHPRYN